MKWFLVRLLGIIFFFIGFGIITFNIFFPYRFESLYSWLLGLIFIIVGLLFGILSYIKRKQKNKS